MGGTAEGIAVLSSRPDGSLGHDGYLAASLSPVFLRRAGSTLYAVGEGSGLFEAFELPSGRLLETDAAGGTGACHITLTESSALVSCYGDGAIGVLSLDLVRLTGRVAAPAGGGPHPEQLRPRTHSTLVVGDKVLSADFGADRLHVHSWRASADARAGARELVRERSVTLPAGSGPRDLVLHPSGVVLLLTQLSNEIIVLSPTFEPIARTAVPGAVDGDFAATLSLSDDGRFGFVGVRGSDLIATLALEITGVGTETTLSVTGLAAVGSAGSRPRHNVVDGDILHVANQASDSVASFAIDEGRLSLLATPTAVASPTHLERA
jgi:6-phosphogluconolactonase (cycloisomerase 2 family)